MSHINYIAHLILNSNYRIFIHLALVFVFYSFLYGNKLILCMNEDTSNQIVQIPRRDIDNVIQGLEEQIRSLKNMRNSILNPLDPVAEAKSAPSHQVLALKREIIKYAGSHVHYLDRINEQEHIIAEQKEAIDRLTTAIEGTTEKRCFYDRDTGESWMEDTLVGGYKNEIRLLNNKNIDLEDDVSMLKSNLKSSKKLIEEYKRTYPQKSIPYKKNDLYQKYFR